MNPEVNQTKLVPDPRQNTENTEAGTNFNLKKSGYKIG